LKKNHCTISNLGFLFFFIQVYELSGLGVHPQEDLAKFGKSSEKSLKIQTLPYIHHMKEIMV